MNFLFSYAQKKTTAMCLFFLPIFYGIHFTLTTLALSYFFPLIHFAFFHRTKIHVFNISICIYSIQKPRNQPMPKPGAQFFIVVVFRSSAILYFSFAVIHSFFSRWCFSFVLSQFLLCVYLCVFLSRRASDGFSIIYFSFFSQTLFHEVYSPWKCVIVCVCVIYIAQTMEKKVAKPQKIERRKLFLSVYAIL